MITLRRMDPIELAFAGAAEHARLLAAGTITSPALIELYLDRISRIDPQLRAYRVVLSDSARAEASAAQARLDAGERLPLLGVPIAVKDDTDVAGEVTTSGSTAHGPAATADSEIVRRLRQAGAVILGKTAVPEMMVWPFTETVAYGATHNPWNPDYTPGGSSGGSGAAVAAGLTSVATGSDGGGSIRIPSSWCGLFGIKPTRDLVSMAPYDEAWNGLSAYGPLARTVEDAALFLDITATVAQQLVSAASRPPGRLRIALSVKVPTAVVAHRDRQRRAAVHDAGRVLRDLGHDVSVREIDYPPTAMYSHVLPRIFRGVHDGAAALPHPERLDSRTRGVARVGGLITDRMMAKIRSAETTIAARVMSIYDDADVVITPGTAAGPSRIGAYRSLGGVTTMTRVSARVPFNAMFNATGQPAASVPWGLDRHGLPMSIQLVGKHFDEATLVSLAAQLESARPWAHMRPPVD